MKLEMLNGIIDFLDHKTEQMLDSTEKIQTLQTKINDLQKQKQKSDEEIVSLQIQLKVTGLSNNFESIYKYLDELSAQGNHRILSKACEKGLWEMIAPENPFLSDEKNVLHIASEKGNLRFVKSLIECGCNKEERSRRCGSTPLMYASKFGHLEVVQYLISVGADKEAKNNNLWTPLHYASKFGHLNIVRYLISIGANKEAKNKEGDTPLICAFRGHHPEVKKYLISIGANTNSLGRFHQLLL